ncbi:hypothetical protein COO60DRAFT_562250 [Scenedesmus sp. NREL 46B-D3]|nr:hypothetical protein COO60DRAFT_562250 [Scenedesmus sp. NREL 46B-D3]
MVFSKTFAALATVILLIGPALTFVLIDVDRLEAEMKYWLCSADGETADLLLHVMVEATVTESQSRNAAVGCATFTQAKQGVSSAISSHNWVPPTSNTAEGTPASWAGCSDTACRQSGSAAAVPLKLEIPTYVRLLEFGHEQAKDCEDAAGAVEAFAQGLTSAGCSVRACSSMDYLAARPVHGCRALVA